MKKRSIVVAATIILTMALATVVMAGDPHVGTWKLNLVKSKYNPGPQPKGFMLKIQARDNGLRYVLDGVDAEGKAIHLAFTLILDGKDYPITGDSSIDTMAAKRIDAYAFDFVNKKNGIEVSRGREVISKDGKTITVTEEGTDEKGQFFRNTFVEDKQ